MKKIILTDEVYHELLSALEALDNNTCSCQLFCDDGYNCKVDDDELCPVRALIVEIQSNTKEVDYTESLKDSEVKECNVLDNLDSDCGDPADMLDKVL